MLLLISCDLRSVNKETSVPNITQIKEIVFKVVFVKTSELSNF